MLKIKLDYSDLQYSVLYMIFCFSVALSGDQIIFLEKPLWLSRISMCLIRNDSPLINYSWMAFSRKEDYDL